MFLGHKVFGYFMVAKRYWNMPIVTQLGQWRELTVYSPQDQLVKSNCKNALEKWS